MVHRGESILSLFQALRAQIDPCMILSRSTKSVTVAGLPLTAVHITIGFVRALSLEHHLMVVASLKILVH